MYTFHLKGKGINIPMALMIFIRFFVFLSFASCCYRLKCKSCTRISSFFPDFYEFYSTPSCIIFVYVGKAHIKNKFLFWSNQLCWKKKMLFSLDQQSTFCNFLVIWLNFNFHHIKRYEICTNNINKIQQRQSTNTCSVWTMDSVNFNWIIHGANVFEFEYFLTWFCAVHCYQAHNFFLFDVDWCVDFCISIAQNCFSHAMRKKKCELFIGYEVFKSFPMSE